MGGRGGYSNGGKSNKSVYGGRGQIPITSLVRGRMKGGKKNSKVR